MPSLSDLPLELYERVLKAIAADPSRKEARAAYVALCLTARAFLKVTQQALYSHVLLIYDDTPVTCGLFQETLRIKPALASTIRSLDLIYESFGYQSDESWAQFLGPTLAKCKQLETIRFSPDKGAYGVSDRYSSIWEGLANLRAFSLTVVKHRDVSLVPTRKLERLTLDFGLRVRSDGHDFEGQIVHAETLCVSRYLEDNMPVGSSLSFIFGGVIEAPSKLHLHRCWINLTALNLLIRFGKSNMTQFIIDATTIQTDRHTANPPFLESIKYIRSEKLLLQIPAIKELENNGVLVEIANSLGADQRWGRFE